MRRNAPRDVREVKMRLHNSDSRTNLATLRIHGGNIFGFLLVHLLSFFCLLLLLLSPSLHLYLFLRLLRHDLSLLPADSLHVPNY
jgi:hypothetical protein